MPLTTLLGPISLPSGGPPDGSKIVPVVFSMLPGERVDALACGLPPNRVSRIASILVDATRTYTGFKVEFGDTRRSILVPSGSESCHLCYSGDGNFSVENLSTIYPAIFRAWLFTCAQPVFERFPGSLVPLTPEDNERGEFECPPGQRTPTLDWTPPIVLGGGGGGRWDTTFAGPDATISGDGYIASLFKRGTVRTRNYRSTGKYYVEFDNRTQGGPYSGVGIANASQGDGVNIGVNSTVIIASNGSVTKGTATPAGPGIPLYRSDRVCLALDFDKRILWAKNLPSDPWNGSGASDPAAGTGGYSFADVPGPWYLSTWCDSTQPHSTELFSGQVAMRGVVPRGFNRGWPAVSA